MLFLAIALITTFFLNACNASDPEGLFGSDPVKETVPSMPNPLPDGSDAVSYGNRQMISYNTNFILHGNAVYFFRMDRTDCSLCIYDLETGEVSSICQDASCDHSDEDCVGTWAHENLESYGGYLYAQKYDSFDNIQSSHLVRLENGFFTDVMEGSIATFQHGNGGLYLVTADHSLAVVEDGNIRILLDEYTEERSVIIGQYLYSGLGKGFCRVDLNAEKPELEVLLPGINGKTDGHHYYFRNAEDKKFYRCDMDGANRELVCDLNVLPSHFNFDGDYLYCCTMDDEQTLYRIPKDTDTEAQEIAQFPHPMFGVYTLPDRELLFVITTENTETGTRYGYYVMNSDGSDLHKLELPEA